jgi:hypothetical protein
MMLQKNAKIAFRRKNAVARLRQAAIHRISAVTLMSRA